MDEARRLFRDQARTEFIIVTIPTVMAVAESERLAASLRQEQVPVRRIVVNQMVRESDVSVPTHPVTSTPLTLTLRPAPQVDASASHSYFDLRRKDQQRALQLLRDDAELSSLAVVQAPLLDLEVRGVPALKYFGDQVWKNAHIPGHGEP